MAYNDHYAQYSQQYGIPNDAQVASSGRERDRSYNGMDKNQGHPQVGATFYPGGMDDFYIPELVSPSPQRIMPEVPEQIQENLAHLELEANGPRSPQSQTSSDYTNRQSSLHSFQHHDPQQDNGYNASRNYEQAQNNDSSYQTTNNGAQSQSRGIQDYPRTYHPLDQPSFSPFPKLHNPPPNVPPTDDEKEATLEQARVPVLNSDNPDMQLAWAQDALAYVEVAIQNEIRVSENQPQRPQTPQAEHQLRVDAISVVSFLADQHHPKAEFMRGMWLEFGKFGFRIDKKEAFRCYSRAADKGYARAEYRIGMQYESSNEPAKAIRHYNMGVKAGDSASNYRLGMMTLLGQHGQNQDYGRGVQLIRFAAQTADENAPQGAYVFGMLQARELPQVNIPEIFLPLDITGARTHIEKAAYLGFARAQLKMGSAYELCQLGCDFNPALSLHYNALAARQGEAEADMAISKWFLCGYDGVFEKDEELAFTYAQRAAQAGLSTAEFAMGYFYEIGMYVPADLNNAGTWYRKAAEHGNKDAVGRIEGIARSNTLSKKDHENVAIARIKSQYGSQRGKRPERFRTPAPPMPTISDGPVDMPDPTSQRNSSTGTQQAYLNPFGGRQAPPRPASVAPYPVENEPARLGPRPGTAAGFVNPNVRPSSAFGINPNIRPTSAATTGGMPPVGHHPGSPAPGYGPQRPYSSMDNVGLGRGRPRPGQRIVSGGSGPQGYRAPVGAGRGGSPNGSPGTGRPQPDLNQPQPPRLNIGFSAPLDASGPEKRSRLQKAPTAPVINNNKAQPPTPIHGYELKDEPQTSNPSKLPSIPHSQTFAGDLRPSSVQSQTGRLPRQDSLPAIARVNGRPQNTPPLSTSATPHPPAKLPNSGPPPSIQQPTAATPRPPGKGPKTFEEMGVPQGKTDSDCILM
ncbi:MAG: hypothetical protein M1827_001699 [Pycnora praestabilis]|nr:MAG: hypothetical protein M1827_001699 [Pycnora praestabilis]